MNGQKIDTAAVGPTLAAEADKLATYAENLKGLASAQDLADRQAALQKLSTSVGAVFTAAGIPGVSSVGTLIADLLHQQELRNRRLTLLRIARAADPAVQRLAQLLQDATVRLQQNIVLARSQTVSDLQAQFASMAPGAPGRAAVAKELVQAADSERGAASLHVDFSTLGRAHQKMIDALANPRTDLAATVAEISTLASEINDVKTSLGPKGGSAS